MRRVNGIKWARMLEGKPPFHTATRSVSVKNIGLRYEKDLAKGLGAKFRHGAWWEYKDSNGPGWCQTDFFGRAKDWIIVLESKLTWTKDAEEQLWELYIPVLSQALGVRRSQILPVVVCKYLTKETDRPVWSTLRDAVQQSMEMSAPFCAVWHHFGGVPRLVEEMGYGKESNAA
jgi:hypothetical protein